MIKFLSFESMLKTEKGAYLHRLPRECALLSGKDDLMSKRLLCETTIPKRLPRECGDPGKRKLPEGAHSYIAYIIDLFEEFIINWIPAFARKSMVEGRFCALNQLGSML
jgi:hypothetical protein